MEGAASSSGAAADGRAGKRQRNWDVDCSLEELVEKGGAADSAAII